MNRPYLKAGLIGAAVLAVVSLMSLVSILSCLALPLMLIGYVAVGALAAHYVPPRRQTGYAAGQGALAGLIASLISGIVQVILTPLGYAVAGGPETMLAQLPVETLQELQQAGINPNALFSGTTVALFSLLCCLPIGLLIGAGLGALGGVIYAAAKPE